MIFIADFDGGYMGKALRSLGMAWMDIEYFPAIKILDTQGLTVEDIRHKVSNTEAWAAIVATDQASSRQLS